MNTSSLRIVADSAIPNVDSLFGQHGNVTLMEAQTITRTALMAADAILLRSVTPANATLLDSTPVQFIGSMTAGIDHLDLEYLHNAHIAWAHAPGANAKTVAQYVLSAIDSLRRTNHLSSGHLRIGIIGVGQVGSAVALALQSQGHTLLMSDPPRAEREPDFTNTPLRFFETLDIVCVHTPLTFTGAHPTYHLLNERFFAQQKPGGVLLNAGRAAVIQIPALKAANHVTTVLDVWENEPDIDAQLVTQTNLATPHIAGYSRAAKERATSLVYQAFCHHFQLDSVHTPLPDEIPEPVDLNAVSYAFKQAIQKSHSISEAFISQRALFLKQRLS